MAKQITGKLRIEEARSFPQVEEATHKVLTDDAAKAAVKEPVRRAASSIYLVIHMANQSTLAGYEGNSST